jgi:hypothetical protein
VAELNHQREKNHAHGNRHHNGQGIGAPIPHEEGLRDSTAFPA